MARVHIDDLNIDVDGYEFGIDSSWGAGIIAGVAIACAVGLGIFIWGIVAAAKTDHVGIQAGRLILHLFIWGGVVAAIVYAVKANGNVNLPHNNQQSNRELELLKRVEELEKQKGKK